MVSLLRFVFSGETGLDAEDFGLLPLPLSGRSPAAPQRRTTRLPSSATAIPAPPSTAVAIPTMFVVTHVRQALQQEAAAGAWSPYLAAI